MTPVEFCDEIWHRKTRIVVLPDSEEIFVLTQYRRVTDGQTDGHVAVAKTCVYEKPIGTKVNDLDLCLEVVSRSLRYIRH